MKSYPILQPDGSVKSKPMNIRRAIKERCFNCSGWSKQDVRACTHENCPLHRFRLGTTKGITSRERNHAVSEYCRWCFNGSRISQCSAENCPLWWTTQKWVRSISGNALSCEKTPTGDRLNQSISTQPIGEHERSKQCANT